MLSSKDIGGGRRPSSRSSYSQENDDKQDKPGIRDISQKLKDISFDLERVGERDFAQLLDTTHSLLQEKLGQINEVQQLRSLVPGRRKQSVATAGSTQPASAARATTNNVQSIRSHRGGELLAVQTKAPMKSIHKAASMPVASFPPISEQKQSGSKVVITDEDDNKDGNGPLMESERERTENVLHVPGPSPEPQPPTTMPPPLHGNHDAQHERVMESAPDVNVIDHLSQTLSRSTAASVIDGVATSSSTEDHLGRHFTEGPKPEEETGKWRLKSVHSEEGSAEVKQEQDVDQHENSIMHPSFVCQDHDTARRAAGGLCKARTCAATLEDNFDTVQIVPDHNSSMDNMVQMSSIRISFNLRKEWTQIQQEAYSHWNQHLALTCSHVEGMAGTDEAVPFMETRNSVSSSINKAKEINDHRCDKTPVFHPGGPLRITWNAICLLLIIYDVITIPLAVFDFEEMDRSIFFSSIEWTCTIYWTLDLLLTFRTGYFVGTNLEDRPMMIALRYLRTWFIIDFLIVSAEWLSVFVTSMENAALMRAFRVIRTLRFLKFLRLAKARDLWRVLKEQINSNVLHLCVSMSIMTIAILAAIHLVSCIWYHIGVQEGALGWITYDQYPSDKDSLFWYLASMRWSIAQLNGRTDMDDRRTMNERAYTCFAGICLSVVVKSLFTSIITKTMIDLSDLRSESNRKRRLVNDYLEHHSISTSLVASVKRYLLDYQDVDKEQKNEKEVLSVLPHHVQTTLLCEVRGPYLTRHPLFSLIADQFTATHRQVCSVVVITVSTVKDEMVFDKAEACTRMLFVQNGKAVYGQPKDDEEMAFLGVMSRAPRALDDRDQHMRAASSHGDAHRMERGSKEVTVSTGIAGIDTKVPLKEHMWLCEAALWVTWNTRGRLCSETVSHLYAIEAGELSQALLQHLDAYSSTVIYAQEFTAQLSKTMIEELSDIPQFQIRPLLPTCGNRSKNFKVAITSAQLEGRPNGTKPSAFCVCRLRNMSLNKGKRKGKSTIKTDTIENSDSPTWNFTSNLTILNDDVLEFTVWDNDPSKHERVSCGRATLRASLFFETGVEETMLQLMSEYKAGPAGHLQVTVEPLESSRSSWRAAEIS